MKLSQYYQEYCAGCGLCKAEKEVAFRELNGFQYPDFSDSSQIEFCKKVCPVNGRLTRAGKQPVLWGRQTGIYRGWSTDSEIRFKAASGGVLTALSVYLVEQKKVDAILQIGDAPDDFRELKLYCNKTREEIVKCSSSRYITCLTFGDIRQYLDRDATYAVIGKPCDMEALSYYLEMKPEYQSKVLYQLTFFCAGASGKNASIRTAQALGINTGHIRGIRYRGNGWPGKAVFYGQDRQLSALPYIESWNQFLGRDIRKMCKFCINGVGETADVSCADLWKLDQNKRLDFSEDDGVNIMFARTARGDRLLADAYAAGYIHREAFTDIADLKYIQPNHFTMRTTMYSKILGLRMMGKAIPRYDRAYLKTLAVQVSLFKKIRTTMGTIKRVWKGSL